MRVKLVVGWCCVVSLGAACGGKAAAIDSGGPIADAAPGAPDAAPGAPDAAPRPDARPTPDAVPATQFADQPATWSVPMSGLADGFYIDDVFANFRYWDLFDIDGDGRPDIVQTGDTAATQRVWDATGSPYWKVFSGGTAGWSVTEAHWSVPSNGLATGFFGDDVTGAGYEWETFDIDGDGRPDLVHTTDPTTGTVWDATGSPHWNVYLNDGSGFGAETVWAVPASGTAAGFYKVLSAGTTAQWATFDIDGDGRPDLVQTSDPTTGKVWDATGSPHWNVFLNNGHGFATTPTLWAVPDPGVATGFNAVSSTAPAWETFDLDGDGQPDLVQTMDPATSVVWDAAGSPHWKVFLGAHGGFAATAILWTVPPSGLSDGFFAVTSAASARRWGVIDLDGDGAPDLVQTGDTAQVQRVWDATGAPYWKVFHNTRTGFSTTLYRWPVPLGGDPVDGFYALSASSGQDFWLTYDVTGDGYPDLVQTADPATAHVWDAAGSPYWKVYRGMP